MYKYQESSELIQRFYTDSMHNNNSHLNYLALYLFTYKSIYIFILYNYYYNPFSSFF